MSAKQKGVCFVCLGGVESNSDVGNEGEFDLYVKFVQFAKYYLKIPSTSLDPLLSFSKTNDGDKMFCGTCEKVVQHICNSYLELVQVQHRLSWKLGELEKLMENSQTSKERVRELAHNLGIRDTAEVGTIRELLSVSCDQMSKKFQPQLVLRRDEALLASFGDSVSLQSDPIVKEEMEYSPENSDNDWDPLADDDEAVSDADEAPSSSTTSMKYEDALMDSQMEQDDDENSDAVPESGSCSDDSSSEDEERSKSSFRARKVANKVTKAADKPTKGHQPPKKLAKVTKISPVSCEVEGCPEQFESHLKLNPHLETHSQSINFCKDCGFGFINVNLLRLHELTHLQLLKSDRKYHCPEAGCSYRDTSISRVQDHYNCRHGVSLIRFKCELCNYVGPSSRSIQEHVGVTHNGKKRRYVYNPQRHKEPKQCIPCGLKCNNMQALTRHRRRFHVRKLCEICKQAFTGTLELTKHVESAHPETVKTEELKFPCLICNKAFPTVEKLELHKTSAHGKKVHECEVCHKLFATSDAVKNRLRKRHLAKTCPHCGIMVGRAAFSDHMLTLHIEKAAIENGPHGCPHCSLRYRRKDYLYRHIFKEHPDAPENLKCSKCEWKKEGGRKSYMKLHELTHLSEEERKLQRKVYICHICGQEFKTMTALSEHAESHEGFE